MSQPQSDFQAINERPEHKLHAHQRAAEERMRQYVAGARNHDQNIERILANNKHDWSSLYSHPKLMGQYYWKDDTIHTNKQRAMEIKKVIQTDFGHNRFRADQRRQNRLSQSLLEPLERNSVTKQKK